ncbi:transcription antitermination factor NusB [Neomicrococcus aestuarii]|uniref:Transcription antitermination protein NusB n=1 Tax=Neomicrococcus aestuarii TaxID=556325 RepID=A0A1L2ZKV5_9MICC|nr:transcription antitermination factor NusB [Neomicrococcus aestuarii]APF40055.1 transcription antitermination factor NusB [Neomicrococcus aestuarii]MBB5512002.1 N utilization substance protein B [Neomicrococcus aestuarii]
MNARTKARLRAVEVLFEAEARDVPIIDAMELRRRVTDQQISAYTESILRGVDSKIARIDEYLETYSKGWSLERMPAVDRSILRVATWELLFNDDVPDKVAVKEAGDIASELSTDDSPEFISGLLGRLLELKPTLLA